MVAAWCYLVLAASTTVPKTKYELLEYEPVADEAATHRAGHARFTILAEALVRIEYSAQDDFEDRPTLAVVQRKTPVPNHSVLRHANGQGITITTSLLELTYKGGPFAQSTLSVAFTKPAPAPAASSWAYGDTSATDPLNLRGTFRTLDRTDNVSLNCNTASHEHCEWGVVSRSGWALVNETGVPVLDENDWWADDSGTMLRNKDDVDLYLFAHGHDYAAAIRDLTTVGGKVPVLPRRNVGVWWTRWYDFDAADVVAIPDDFAANAFPLDVLVLDMNWHSKQSWTGYTWDGGLYPDPSETMAQLHARGLSVSANLHDALGIGLWEDTHAAVASRLGRAADEAIPLSLTNRSYVLALEDVTVAAREAEGMDFWWIDWQQGETKGNTGQDGPRHKMNPTIWLNKLRTTDAKRRCVDGVGASCDKRRGVTFGRFGGLGNHRYQHGFSGDVANVDWANMAYQAYFTATASNVAFGWWSHDLVGPNNGDYELYTRWLQLGAYSPIMRMHDRGMSAGSCFGWPTDATKCHMDVPWSVPAAFAAANRDAARARAALVPYVYTSARASHDSGLGLCRPLYYSYPEHDEAYPESMDALLGQTPGTRQYMFGPSLLVAPVTAPGTCPPPRGQGLLQEPCGLTAHTVWLPPGEWYEIHTGAVRSGPATVELAIHLLDVPIYAIGGSVVPRRLLAAPGHADPVGLAASSYTSIEWTLYPATGGKSFLAGTAGSGALYEDDGETTAYLDGESAWTNLTYSWDAAGATLSIEIQREGSFAGIAIDATHTIRLPATLAPTRVAIEGEALPFARRPKEGSATWSYDGVAMTTVIHAATSPAANKLAITVDTPRAAADAISGFSGMIIAARRAKHNLDEARMTPGSQQPDPEASLTRLAMLGDRLAAAAGGDAAAFKKMAMSVPTLGSAALTKLESIQPASRVQYAVDLLKSAGISDEVDSSGATAAAA